MAAPKRDNGAAARALVDAALTTDAQACGKHGIALRTLQNYRAVMKTDPELARMYVEMLQLATAQDWAVELGTTFNVMTQKLRALAIDLQDANPESIAALTEAVLGMAEIVMTREIVAAQLAAQQPQLAGKSHQPAPKLQN